MLNMFESLKLQLKPQAESIIVTLHIKTTSPNSYSDSAHHIGPRLVRHILSQPPRKRPTRVRVQFSLNRRARWDHLHVVGPQNFE